MPIVIYFVSNPHMYLHNMFEFDAPNSCYFEAVKTEVRFMHAQTGGECVRV